MRSLTTFVANSLFTARAHAGIALLWALFFATSAYADRTFSVRYSVNTNGELKLIGNTLLHCPATSPAGASGDPLCDTARAGGAGDDNNFAMAFVDIDSDPSTFNSSSATLSMPPGSTVLFAGLYWGAKSTNAARNQALLSAPGAFGYMPISASVLDTSTNNQYQGFADITSVVSVGGAGVYTVANVQADVGANNWGGWSMVVVYQNNSELLRNLVVYDGMQNCNSCGTPITITPSGFLTPLTGPVDAKMGIVVYDGDQGFGGDSFSLNGVAITDAQNPAGQFYNSTISELGANLPGRYPNYVNNLGLDIDRIQIPTGVMPNGSTSATIRAQTTSENIYIGVITFGTQLYVPIITPNIVKTATDLNGGLLLPGDTLRYNISLSNTGLDTGTNVILTDPIPAGTTYKPNSLRIVTGPNAGVKSDSSGALDDQAEFLTSPNRVVFRLGTGANGTVGGSLATGVATSVEFDVVVNAVPSGTTINNVVQIAYSGQTLAQSYSSSSSANTATITLAPTIAKSFSPNPIQVGGTSVLSIDVMNPASNSATITGVVFSDTYPGTITNTSSPNPQIVCTSGGTPGSITGGAANGSTIGLGGAGATLAPGSSCTITVNVTGSASGNITNTTGNVSSTNAGTGGVASATLSVGKPGITKSFLPATITSGQTTVMTLVIANTLATPLTNVNFTDMLVGMQVAATPGVVGNCGGGTVSAVAASALVSLTGGSLAASSNCTITVNIASTTAGVQSNTTSGVNSAETVTAGSPSNTAMLTVIANPLATKSFNPPSVSANVASQLRITVSNPNTGTTLTGVAFTDTYPMGSGLANVTPFPNTTLSCTAGSSATLVGGAASGTTLGLSASTLLPGGSCTLTTNVVTATTGNHLNTTGNISSTNGGTGAPATASLNVTTLTPPTATKAFSPVAIIPGGTSTMTITVTNPNAGTAVTGLAFTDPYPGGLVNAAVPNVMTSGCGSPTVTANAGGSSLAFSGGGIVASGVCTVSVLVTAASAGSYFNQTSTISTTNAGITVGPSATLDVLTPPSVAKTFSSPSALINTNVTLTLTLTNNNSVALTGVTINDLFPVNLTARGTPASTNTCGGSFQGRTGAGAFGAIANGNTEVRLTGGTIPANSTCVLTATVRGSAAASYVNTTSAFSATGPIAITGNNSTATLDVGQVAVAKAFATTPIAPGATSLLTFSLTNSSGVAVTGLQFTDTYPAGLVNATPLTVGGTCTGVTTTAAAGGGTFNVTAGNVPTAGCTITVSTTSSTPGIYDNVTSGVTHSADALPGNQSNIARIIVRSPPVVSKSMSPTVLLPGQTATLTISLQNLNADAISGVNATDTFPVGLKVAASPNVTATNCTILASAITNLSNGVVVANDTGIKIPGATIPLNSTCVVTVDVTSSSAATYVNSTGSVTTTNAGTSSAAMATITFMGPPTVAKSFSPTSIAAGGTSTLTIALTNPNAGQAISGIALTDTYPPQLFNATVPGIVNTCGGTVTGLPNGTSLALTGASIAAGGNCAVSIDVTSAVTGTRANSTGAITTTNAGSGASAMANLDVFVAPTFTKAFAMPKTIGVAGTTTITFTLTNGNTTPLTGATFSDDFPSGMSLSSTSLTGTTCAAGSVTSRLTNMGAFGAIAAGHTSIQVAGYTIPASGSCIVVVNVTAASAGAVVNTTSALSTTQGTSTAAASDTLNVQQATLTKAWSVATIDDGAPTNLVFTLTNSGTNPAQAGIAFTESLPASLKFTNATPVVTFGAGCSGTSLVTQGMPDTIAFSAVSMASSTASCTITVAAVTSRPGQVNLSCVTNPAAFTNTSGNISGIAIAANGVSTQCLAVNPVADLIIAKTNGVASVNAGLTTNVYTLTVTNNGPSSVTAAILADASAAGLTKTAVACSGTPGQCVTPPTIAQLEGGAFTLPALTSGQTYQITVTTTVTASTGSVANAASIQTPAGTLNSGLSCVTGGGITRSFNAGTNTCTSTDTDSVITPDLTLEKTTSTIFTVGGAASFTLTPRNTLGTAPTNGIITVVDVLPAGLTYVAAGSGGIGWACGSVAQTVTCTSSTVITAGMTGNAITINVTIASNAAPSVTNTATISGGGELASNTGNNSAILTVPVGNLAVNSFLTDGAQTGLPGTSVLYTHVFNASLSGSVSFAATEIATPFVAGWGVLIYRDFNCNGMLDGTDGAAELTSSIVVAPGAQICIVVKSNIPAAVPYNAQDVIAVTATFVPVAGPNITYTRQDITTVGAAGGAGLTLAKTVRNVTTGGLAGTSNVAGPGQVLEYVISYSNNSGSSVNTIVISDNTPAFTNFSSASCGAPLPVAISACAVTIQPSVGGAGNIQWTLTGALNPAQTGSVIFRVTVQ